MKITAIMPCRNSEWIIGLSARAVLRWCDELVVLMHNCTDGTAEILFGMHDRRIWTMEVNEPDWREMDHRQSLLRSARSSHATHIALVDDDEVLTGNLLPHIREQFAQLPPGHIFQLPWLCLRNGIDQVHTDGTWGTANVSIGFQDHPSFHWGVQPGNYHHHHRHPMGRPFAPWPRTNPRSGGLMHLQFASERRLRAKQAWYKMQEVLRWPEKKRADINRMYNIAVYGHQDGWVPMKMESVPACWWEPYWDIMPHLKLDAEPWQEAECKRMWSEHGAARFEGLDLFGVCQK